MHNYYYMLLSYLSSLQQNTNIITAKQLYTKYTYVMSSSVTSGSSTEFKDTRYNFSQMPDVLLTLSYIYSIPKRVDSFHKLLLVLLGFISRRKNSLSSCQRFSIGFRSGDSGGVFHQLISPSSRNCCACRDVCLGSLSCMKRWWSGKTSLTKGRSVLSRMLVYIAAFILPSNIHIPHRPRRLMPPHTCTFTGCLAL